MEGTITLNSEEINIKHACRLTGLSERQVYRKQKAYKEDGIKSIPHKLKLKPSKNYPWVKQGNFKKLSQGRTLVSLS